MPNTFAKDLKKWRGNRYRKDAAWTLGITYPLYRLYECGKRTPCKLAMCELQRRMIENPDRLDQHRGINRDLEGTVKKELDDFRFVERTERIAVKLAVGLRAQPA